MKPEWLKIKLPQETNYELVKMRLHKKNVNTVCIEARCPNRIECWSQKAMTFMILGNICTRKCKFCAVTTGNPMGKIDEQEPNKIVQTVKELSLNYVVITSVTRDDLSDGGATVFSDVIRAIRKICPDVKIEVLVPDFSGTVSAIKKVIDANCDIFNHNLETIERLTPVVRDRRASYRTSLQVLSTARRIKPSLVTKSGIMVGLGEAENEVEKTIKDLFDNGVEVLTIGQYLQPAKEQIPVCEYIRPEIFQHYKNFALDLGFKKVSASPMVRSSYHCQ
jgi:lipoic acid synthetase